MYLPINLSRRTFIHRGELCTFVPRSKLEWFGPTVRSSRSPMRDDEGPLLFSARFFVGLYVNGKPMWKARDVEDAVVKKRKKQTTKVGASFLKQRGVWLDSQGKPEREKSVHVVILNKDPGITIKAFEKQMIDLTEWLCKKLKQEEIILEIQNNGIIHRSGTITP